jgi:hypothetical protein
VDVESALTQAMQENSLDPAYRGVIRSLLARRDDFWRRCCGSNCEPCALTYCRVVDRVRQLSAGSEPA